MQLSYQLIYGFLAAISIISLIVGLMCIIQRRFGRDLLVVGVVLVCIGGYTGYIVSNQATVTIESGENRGSTNVLNTSTQSYHQLVR